MKLQAKRLFIEFEYEYLDGSSASFRYMEPTTELIDGGIDIRDADVKEKMEYAKKALRSCLSGNENDIEKMIAELTTHANIYKFKVTLDEALGKLKAEGSNG
ncbi:hypothetical protein [Hydrogenimonas urashimensis]|uniref:hypothetical protein n=1 Tax=Hydrogenimonas urashimensis TaxID=2740515 RepID=UPI0019153D8E|nr:hypothetical protein [Hydrogenimonas urashimensis]